MFNYGSRKWAGLAKIVEETGELNQVIGKLMANNGEDIHFSGDNLREKLEEELSDALAAILFAIMHNSDLDIEQVGKRTGKKIARFMDWHKQNLEK